MVLKAHDPELPGNRVPVADHHAPEAGRRLAFHNVPAGLDRVARIKLLLVANVPVLQVPGFRRRSPESLCMRASRPPRVGVRSWRSDSPKANVSFIPCVPVPVQVPAAALFLRSR